MKKPLIILILCAIALISQPDYANARGFSLRKGWQINLDQRIGGAIYEEGDSNIKSDWDSLYFRTDLAVDNLKDKETRLKFRGGLGWLIASTGTERWDVSSIRYQTNDMDFWGLNPSIDIGYQLLNIEPKQKLSFTPFIGYGYKMVKFKRGEFNILNTITSRDVVSETYHINYLDLGAYIDCELRDNWGFFSRLSYSPVFSNTADNSSLGSVTGHGGYLGNIDAGFDYHFNPSSCISFGGFIELQHLKGGTKNNIIWPDNDLNAYGVLLRYRTDIENLLPRNTAVKK